MIEAQAPANWQDLQEKVAKILGECGLRAEIEKHIETARGGVVVDVFAEDAYQAPSTTYICECKDWSRRVPRTVVHSLQTVVANCGANWGLIISSVGFQKGAYEAAQNTNVRLLTWMEFQALFEDRWFDRYFVPTLSQEADPLIEYTEPVNSRIFRKADALNPGAQKRFNELRHLYYPLGYLGLTFWSAQRLGAGRFSGLPLLDLPGVKHEELAEQLPRDLLEVTSLRDFLVAYITHSRKAIAEFDGLFGGRA